MKPVSTLRVARPTDQLAAITAMYTRGLGFSVLAEFTAHDGFDGVIVGQPGQPYHLEFTTQHGHVVGAHQQRSEDLDEYRVVLENAAWSR